MKTFTYSSKTSDATHTVKVYPDGRVTCSCLGFNSPSRCWHYRKHAVETQPTIDFSQTDAFVKPMLASALPEGLSIVQYSTPAYVLEEKIDGHRLIIETREDGLTAWSRQGNVRDLPPHLIKALKRLPPLTLDSELFVPGGTSTDVTDLKKQHLLQIKLFDVLRVGPHSAMNRPGTERRDLLVFVCAERLDPKGPVTIIPQFDVEASILDAVWAAGLEGVIVKRRAAVYQSDRRSTDWIKFKKPYALPVTIVRFEAGRYGPHSVVVGVDKEGIEVKVKSLNDDWRLKFSVGSEQYIGKTMVISHQGKTSGGKKYKSAMADHIL